jgi:hypothetical protein
MICKQGLQLLSVGQDALVALSVNQDGGAVAHGGTAVLAEAATSADLRVNDGAGEAVG